MTRARPFAFALGTAALLAIVVPGLGSSSTTRRTQCNPPGTYTGLEAVFGRTTKAGSTRLRARVLHNGFANAAIIQDCTGYRVVVRGMESFDVAYELQAEARRVSYKATVECVQGQDNFGEIEAVFGHRRSRADAADLVTLAASEGFTGLQLEPDPCGGFEVMFKGFSSRRQAEDYVEEAGHGGFKVALEDS